MEAVKSKVHIRVGLIDIDLDALRERYGPGMLE